MKKVSMILFSNKTFVDWGDIFGDQVLATAILDRLLHHATTLNIKGESYRLKEKRKAGLLGRSVNAKPLHAESPNRPDHTAWATSTALNRGHFRLLEGGQTASALTAWRCMLVATCDRSGGEVHRSLFCYRQLLLALGQAALQARNLNGRGTLRLALAYVRLAPSSASPSPYQSPILIFQLT
jgi:hypothetical protein